MAMAGTEYIQNIKEVPVRDLNAVFAYIVLQTTHIEIFQRKFNLGHNCSIYC